MSEAKDGEVIERRHALPGFGCGGKQYVGTGDGREVRELDFDVDPLDPAGWSRSLDGGQNRRRAGSRLDAHEVFIRRLIDELKDITLNEMILRLSDETPDSAVRRVEEVGLRERGWFFQKRPDMPWSRNA